MRRSKNQNGFSAFEIILAVVALIAIGAAGYYAYKAHHPATVSTVATPRVATKAPTTQTPPTSSGQPYTDTSKNYTLSYPTGWSQCEPPSGATNTTFINSACFGPSANTALVVVSSYKSTLAPEQWSKTEAGATLPYQLQNSASINGYPAYNEVDGDSTYTNESYVLAHNGVIVSVFMTVKMTSPTAADNSQYVAQLTSIANSIKFTN